MSLLTTQQTDRVARMAARAVPPNLHDRFINHVVNELLRMRMRIVTDNDVNRAIEGASRD